MKKSNEEEKSLILISVVISSMVIGLLIMLPIYYYKQGQIVMYNSILKYGQCVRNDIDIQACKDVYLPSWVRIKVKGVL